MAISSTLFSVLLWGALLGVFLVFCYEMYVVTGHGVGDLLSYRND
ncbi:MAG: hypothetical protein V5A39_08040 [Haloarculaceae archaeon]